MADTADQQNPTPQDKPTVDTTFLSPEERMEMKRYLSFPEEFPQKFGAYIADYIAVNGLSIPISQIVGFQRFLYRTGPALPSTPEQGQFFGLQVSAGITWQFRYDETITDAYKWVFMGGPALEVSTSATVSTTGFAAYQDIGGALGFTVPNAGVYKVEHGCAAKSSNTASEALASIYPNTTPSDNDACMNTTATYVAVSKACFVTVAAAGGTVKQQYKTTNGTVGASWKNRWLLVTPSRVS